MKIIEEMARNNIVHDGAEATSQLSDISTQILYPFAKVYKKASCKAVEPVWMIWMRILIAHRKKYSIFAKNKVFKQTIWIHKNHTS